MTPDELNRRLGPNHQVPWLRLVQICEEFDSEVEETARRMIAEHEATCPARKMWPRLHTN